MINEFENSKKETFDLISALEELQKILQRNFKSIIISSCIILFMILVYLLYTPKQFNTFAKIKILEENETSAFILEDMMNIDGAFRNEQILENEIEILKSKKILELVIEELKLNHFYTENNFIKNINLNYNQIPFISNISSNNEKTFIITVNTEEKFTIKNNNDKTVTRMFGEKFVLEEDTINIKKARWFTPDIIDKQFTLQILDKYKTFLNLKNRLNLSPITDVTLQLSITGNDTKLNTKIIEKLLSVYNDDGNYDNKILSQSTSSFLNERIKFIKSDITLLENTLSEIKKGSDVFDISTINSIFSNQKLVSTEMNFEIETQKLLANSFYNKLQNHNYADLLPLPMEVGIENVELASFTSEFNKFVIERNKLLKGRTTENPEIQLLNTQLNKLLTNLNGSIINYINNLEIKQNKISNYDNNLESEFYKLNDVEFTIIKLTKELEVKSSILFFLLEKKEENDLKLAVDIPTFKILDPPYTDFINPKPNTKKYSILGLLISLLLPILLILLKNGLYNKITDKKSVEKYLDNNIPIIGEIPLSEETRISNNIKGLLIESFRLVRTNLNYLLNSNEKVILITSSIKGEGKTFTAINLTKTISLINNKKVLLLGLDLRNPQLHKYLNVEKNKLGITNYLINENTDLNSLINNEKSFDFILSGPIPPNPAELLSSRKMKEFIEIVKEKYDYVIIDSAPCLLVADTLNITKYTDTTLYVTKSKHTKIETINYINQLAKEKTIKNLAIIINGLEKNKNGYSYNYGYNYGYNEES